MARTYTDTPEPRYVERARESETTSALPEIKNADRGKFLKVKANKNELMYDSIPNEVPEPTIADAGKVLGVDDEGEWALVEGGGGLIVNFIYDTEAPHSIVAIDRTYNEITSVLNAGGCVRAKNVTEQAQEGYMMTSINYLDIVFCAIMTFDDPSSGTQYGVSIDFKDGQQPLAFMAISPDGTLEIVK